MGTESTGTGPKLWSALSCCRGLRVPGWALTCAGPRPWEANSAVKVKLRSQEMRFNQNPADQGVQPDGEVGGGFRARNSSCQGTLEALLECFHWAGSFREDDLQVLEGLL